MKTISCLRMFFAASLILSCSKNRSPNLISIDVSNKTINQKWSIESDSSFLGVGLGNHAVNYAGIEGDYFDFRQDSNLYIKESSNLQVVPYSMINDTTLIIPNFGISLNGIPDTTHISNVDAHHAILLAPFIATPGGTFGRKVILYK